MHKESGTTNFFIHIPKTAGSTMMSLIWREYKHEKIFHVMKRDFEDFRSLSERERDNYKLVGGHMCYGVHDLVSNPGTYFTILRDPVKRIVSYYYYVRSQPNSDWYQMAMNMNLAEFVEKSQVPEVNNGQLRRLYGVEGFNVEFGACKPDMLTIVKQQILKHFSVVGLTERFYETIVLLSDVYSWRLLPFLNKNVSRSKPKSRSIDKQTMDVIIRYNQLDIELYNFSQEQFDDRIEMGGKGFRTRVDFYRSINRLINSFYKPFVSSR